MQKSNIEYLPLQKLDGDVEDWIESLPFQLTGDQKRTVAEIKKDMSGDIAMRRVVVGDVGSGKTMVILASMVIASKHKSALMAPTSILAEQLFEEAQKFLPEELKIVLLTSKTSKKEKLDDFDVLIGTNAILYRELPEIPLIIVDEQHRFGTKHRNRLEELVKSGEKRPHFIQLSATPIPRTQAMINGSVIKTSLIEETPFKKDIDTEIIFSKHFPELLEKIRDEISKNNQILLIYPLVEESEKINYQSLEESEGYWRSNFQNVYVTHGKDKEKESVLKEFRESGDILLATTVVEVGISLPRLTVIVIVGAERLGLATLHQLRGRVSRTGLKGYCYLYTKAKASESIKRLKDFSKTTNGFDIASMDLKNRKGGDIVKGVKQSGDTFQWLNMASDIDVIEDVLTHQNKGLKE
jgi:ATP-dependent DNA helicase RecG